MHVERHAVDRDLFANSFEKNRRSLTDYLARRPVTSRLLLGLHGVAVRVLGYGSVLSPDDPSLPLAGRTHPQATAALLALLSGLDGPFPFGEDRVTPDMPSRGPDVVRTIQSLYLALIYGDTASRELIARMPPATLRQTTTKTDPFWLTWKHGLDSITSAPEHALRRLREAQAGIESATVGRADALQRARHTLSLFEAVLTDDADAAAKRLVTALEAHRAFWSSDDNDNLPDGLVSLSASAAVALARERGLSLDVESAYLVRPPA